MEKKTIAKDPRLSALLGAILAQSPDLEDTYGYHRLLAAGIVHQITDDRSSSGANSSVVT